MRYKTAAIVAVSHCRGQMINAHRRRLVTNQRKKVKSCQWSTGASIADF
jgi:hypothetical protein